MKNHYYIETTISEANKWLFYLLPSIEFGRDMSGCLFFQIAWLLFEFSVYRDDE